MVILIRYSDNIPLVVGQNGLSSPPLPERYCPECSGRVSGTECAVCGFISKTVEDFIIRAEER